MVAFFGDLLTKFHNLLESSLDVLTSAKIPNFSEKSPMAALFSL
jgi:hypothetical protein